MSVSPRARSFATIGILGAVATLALDFNHTASARERHCWADSKTGKKVNDVPAGGAEADLTDPNRAFNPANGRNYFRAADGTWNDSLTGRPVNDAPAGGAEVDLTNPNRAFNPANGRNYHRIPCPPTSAAAPTSQIGMVTPGPSIKLGLEAGGGWARNGFEDFNFNGSGFVGGVSGQLTFPIGGGYAGLGVSVLGSGISGTPSDPITSNIQLLVPIDGILGITFTPSSFQRPLSIYAFGGLAIGNVKVNAPPFSGTGTMTGWSIGIGGDLQLSPTWSMGVKYRHFDLGTTNFSVFPGMQSIVSERGDIVTGTLSYSIPLLR